MRERSTITKKKQQQKRNKKGENVDEVKRQIHFAMNDER